MGTLKSSKTEKSLVFKVVNTNEIALHVSLFQNLKIVTNN